jgi:hypothetical protein
VQIDRLSLVLANGMSQHIDRREFSTPYRQFDVETIPLITRAIGRRNGRLWPSTSLRRAAIPTRSESCGKASGVIDLTRATPTLQRSSGETVLRGEE